MLSLVLAAGCGRLGFDPTSSDARPPAGYHDSVLADGPVAYWRLADLGTVARDEQSARLGTYQGGCTHGVPGALGASGDLALELDGTCTIVLDDQLDFAGRAPYSIEAWVAPTTGGNVFGHLFARQTRMATGPIDGYSVVFAAANNEIYFERSIATDNRGSPHAIVQLGVLVHVVGVYDGATSALYIDGDARGVPTQDARVAPPFAAEPHIGSAPSENFLAGVLDEVAIYDKALSPSQVKAHYDARGM